MTMGGALWSTSFRNQVSGVPNRTTAETCDAMAAGSGPVMPAGGSYPAGNGTGGGVTGYCGNLRITAQYDLRRRASRRDRLNPIAGVCDSVCGLPEVQRCRVIHRIYVDASAWQACAERVDERLSRRANTGWLERAAGEHDFHVGTRVVAAFADAVGA